jgi:hypothetical protein
MRAFPAFALALAVVAGPAAAQYAPGSIGNGGRMPQTMSPGALPPPPTSLSYPSTSSSPSVPSSSLGARYPNTESMARERVESRGYQVDRITRQNNGSWKAEATRDATPTRPLGVPSRIIIYPDGRVVEEREPLNARPQPSPPVE